jgi:TRAP-type C4-dicarboxylate transport system substrate-binding protein
MIVKKFCRWAWPVILLAVVVTACSKKPETVTMNTAAFDSAPATIKQKWNAAGESMAKKNYLGAATNLISVLDGAKELSAEQKDVLQKTWAELGEKTYAAAETGDKAAIEAIQTIRNSKYGRPEGR